MAKIKYLLETSVLPAALENSVPAQHQELRDIVGDGGLYTSTYIRMEFIRRWICGMLRLALLTSLHSSVTTALAILEQSFGARDPKACLAFVRRLLTYHGTITTNIGAEEIARCVVQWLDDFDEIFQNTIPNHSKCQIGQNDLDLDFDHLITDMNLFYEEFTTPVEDCEINAFLDLSNSDSIARSILDSSDAMKLKPVENLAALKKTGKTITCRECAKIGDVVIALEQPNSVTLIHGDKSFDCLCDLRGRKHIYLESVTALVKQQEPATGTD